MKIKIFFTVILIYFSLSLNAQWQKVFYNGDAGSIVANDSIIIVGNSLAYVLISNGNDSIWNLSIPCNLCGWSFPILAISGTNILVGNMDDLFLTTDNGLHWDTVIGLPQYSLVNSITVSGANIYTGINKGVYLSTDNGISWNVLNNSFTNASVRTIAVFDSTIFVGTWGSGVFSSSDNGSNWVSANNGLPNPAYINSFARIGTNIFAGAYNGSGVFLSTDEGNSWSVSNNSFNSSKLNSLTVSGTNVFVSFYDIGVFMSPDTGKTWIAVNEGFTDSTIYGLTISGSYLYAAAEWSGVWKRSLSEMSDIAENKINAHFMLYPNPTTSQITIQTQDSNNKESEIIIQNILGKQVLLTKISNSKTIDISTLQKGVYFLQLLENNRIIVTQKLIKQ